MSNVLDYINWRGDLSLKESRFNEVDNLILARFSYFPFDNIIKKEEVVTIKELSERFENKYNKKTTILWPDDVNLFPLMGKSIRFGKMFATQYSNIFDKEKEEQFATITVILPGDLMYVSFRGTDDTVIGWKEDFNLSFKSHTPSQISSKNYLEKIAKRYPEKRIIVGGHSKGGNLAIYSAAFVSEEVKRRIIKVYNNDGPGFCEDIIDSAEYQSVLKLVHSYIPQSSVIGRLMNHEEKYSVVESTQKGIMQHDLYSWQVQGPKFILSDSLTNKSDFIDRTITGWVTSIEPERREQFINTIYEILCTADGDTIKGIKKNWQSNYKTMLKSYKNLDKESKKMINEVLSSLLKNATTSALPKLEKLDKNSNK